MAARLQAEAKDEYSTPETGKRKTLKLAWERVDPEALKEVVRKTLHGMAAEERTLFYEKLILELEQGAIGVGAYLMILGITASTPDAITPLEWGHLIRYFRVNVPHAMRAVSKVLGRFPAFSQQAEESYRLCPLKGFVSEEKPIGNVNDFHLWRAAFRPKCGVLRRSSYTRGSPERSPGALFRAMGALFLRKNPTSRSALARRLRQQLLRCGIKYHLRTLRRQLAGTVSSVPPEVENAMRQLLLDGGGLKTVEDIDEALAAAGLQVEPSQRLSPHVSIKAILPLVELWLYLNPGGSKRFLACRLQNELEFDGIRQALGSLEATLSGKHRLARREIPEKLLALLAEHGIHSEVQARTLYENLAKEIRQSLDARGFEKRQRFTQLCQIWKLYHRQASSKPLAVRLQQKMLERGVVISLDQLGRLVNGRTGRVRSRITSAMEELLRRECAGIQNLDEEIARLTSKTGRENDLCWVQAKPIAILARTWISEHPGSTMRQLAVRVWQTIRRMGYRRSVNSVQPILGGWKKKTRGFVYRAMLSQFKRPDQTRIPKEHIIGPAWAIGLGPPERSSTKCYADWRRRVQMFQSEAK